MTREKSVVFSPEAETQIVALHDYIASRTSPAVAGNFVNAIIERCEHLGLTPLQGVARDDIRQGLRTTSFRRRVVIAYSVEPKTVTVLAIFYGGQDYESLLGED